MNRSQFSIQEQIPSRDKKNAKGIFANNYECPYCLDGGGSFEYTAICKKLISTSIYRGLNVRRSVGNQGSSNEYLYSEYLADSFDPRGML